MAKLNKSKKRNSNNSRRQKKSSRKNDQSTKDSSKENNQLSDISPRKEASNLNFGLQFSMTWIVIIIAVKCFTYIEKSSFVTKGESDINSTSYYGTSDKEFSAYDISGSSVSNISYLISEEERKAFHPVVIFPKIWKDVNVSVPESEEHRAVTIRRKMLEYSVLDLSTMENNKTTALDFECTILQTVLFRCRRGVRSSVGKYNENRIGLYKTALFENVSNDIDGFSGQRTIHMGIDLFGRVGDKVYAFADGTVHSAGYNAAFGDYGNVVVLKHTLNDDVTLWALYGHLDRKSIRGKKVGKTIKKGMVVGRMGDVHENGGWDYPHVHFQIAINEPKTHDMPGVVSMEDREGALIEYPDPQYVLGFFY